MKRLAAAVLSTLLVFAAQAEEWPLPPLVEWNGESRSLIADPDDPWITPFELGDLKTSPSYEETVRWLETLVEAAPELHMISIGRSAQGREIPMVVASADGATTPAALRANGRPTLLVHAGIHSGEIDGKDAGMMLLRDLTVGDRLDLLDEVNLLFIPILNVDGHERRSAFNRVNQRGPREMGWRTNSRNLNLNRDFTKLDTEGVRALVNVINEWSPQLHIDVHVTDGADYQYDITWGSNGPHAHSPAGASWLRERFDPKVSRALTSMGHVPGPLIFGVDPIDIEAGIADWTADPRFSTGYGDARHLPSILVENHSLDPYDRRVLGTYVFLEAAMRAVAEYRRELFDAIRADEARRPEEFPLAWAYGSPPEPVEFLGIEQRERLSEASGGVWRDYTGKPVTLQVPVFSKDQVAASVTSPRAWWVPGQWANVIELVRFHGIEHETLDVPRRIELDMYRLSDPEFDEVPFEGRVRVAADAEVETREIVMPAGSIRVPADQPLADLAALLLEPVSPDSFLQWGFFHPIFSRTEYIEDYVIDPLAKQMLERDPELLEEFMLALRTNDALRTSTEERRRWFYERSPFYDEQYLLYPVGRER